MRKSIKKLVAKISHVLCGALNEALVFENQKLRADILNMIRDSEMRIACIAAQALARKKLSDVHSITETEFRVYSQFGEDGIIQFLISNLFIPNKTFVEFGVEDYSESNTRFLLVNNNWSGLVIDGSKGHVDKIKQDSIHWKHDLTALDAFITKDNINDLISKRFSGDIGLLSIDIDGNDYWVWSAINIVKPRIVICEYNSLFGAKKSISIPYQPDFTRQGAHFSNLYFGASLKALCTLAEEKGYCFVGCNSAGCNAFFVRKDIIGDLKVLGASEGYISSKLRQSRDRENNLTFLSNEDSIKLIGSMSVHDFAAGQLIKLSELAGK